MIKFKCINKDKNHNKEMKIKEYLNQMKKIKNINRNEKCEIHKKNIKYFVLIVINIYVNYV